MSKPIVMTEDLIARAVAEFREKLAGIKMSNGSVTYTKKFCYTGQDAIKVHVMFTPAAYCKMLALVQNFDSEVAWHGKVVRKSDDLFIITDIVVYPQEVTGATVNTDQTRYQKWLISLDMDFFNAMRMQGHSHVMMGTSPSAVDMQHQESILSQMRGDDYYIFMIWNKKLEHTIGVYDFATNTMYENADVITGVLDDEVDTEAFVAEAKQLVQKRAAVQTAPHTAYSGYPSSYQTQAAASGATKASGSKEKGKKSGEKKSAAYAPQSSFFDPKKPDYDKIIFGDRYGYYGEDFDE